MRQRNLVFWSTTTTSSSHVADLSKFSNFQRVLSYTLVCSGSVFTAAATFYVLVHLPTQVRGGIGPDSRRVLTRTLGEYLVSGLPRETHLRLIIMLVLH